MFFIGFATAEETEQLKAIGLDVKDAPAGCLSVSTAEYSDGYMFTESKTGPDGAKAVAIFFNATLFQAVCTLEEATRFMQDAGELNVVEFIRRKNAMQDSAYELLSDATNYNYCNHKNPDGSDARYPTGGGAMACICGNKWD